VDIIGAIRSGEDMEELKKIFIDAIDNREPYYGGC